MPVVDMPLEKLYQFAGLNERPDDMEAYWDRAIAEMESLGTGCELIPAAFQVDGAECFDLYFTGVGGARIHCRYARPAVREGKIPAICRYHGYSGNCGSFSSLLNWVAAGFAIASMTCRGQGGYSEDSVSVKGKRRKNTLPMYVKCLKNSFAAAMWTTLISTFAIMSARTTLTVLLTAERLHSLSRCSVRARSATSASPRTDAPIPCAALPRCATRTSVSSRSIILTGPIRMPHSSIRF